MDFLRKIWSAFKASRRAEKSLAFFLFFMVAVSGGMWASYLALIGPPPPETARVVNYSEFMEMASKGEISTALVGANTVDARDAEGREIIFYHNRWFFMSNLPRDLDELGVEVRFHTPADRTFQDSLIGAAQVVFYVGLALLFAFILWFLLNMMKGSSSVGWPVVVRNSGVRFADVAGQEETKFELEEIREFLRNPGAFEKTGAKPPRGVLMVGPPGTGKTLLARALAGEAGVSFIAVTGSDFANMYVGVGRNKVEKLFRKARAAAPCIIFIDEIDSVARMRSGSTSDVGKEKDTTLNQLLTEMQGFSPRDGIVVIAATNRIDVIDPAILRPGRFDRHVHVNHTDMEGRRLILEVHVKGKPLAGDVDLQTVARGTPGFTGADIENLVNEAAILAARERADEISARHFEEARDKVLMGLARRSLVIDDSERRITAVHEAGHALAACLMPGTDPVHQATIVPRGPALGMVMQLPERDRFMTPKSRLTSGLVVLMAGRAAEETVFGKDGVTTGAASDIVEATRIARSMVTEWGMDDEIGMVRIGDEQGHLPEFAAKRVRETVEKAYAQALALVTEQRPALDALADALYARKTMDGHEVRQIVAEKASAAKG